MMFSKMTIDAAEWFWLLIALSAVLGLLSPSIASANPEATVYDTRSVSLGLTGVTYLERPAALAINPALLEGVEKFSASVMFSPLFINQQAPVQGPGSSVKSGVSIGPIGSVYLAGRVAPRLVLAAGFYVETGFAAGFSGVPNIDGVPSPPQDLEVQFFVLEIAVATSIRLNSKVNLGIALRIPYARQSADIYANTAPAFIQPDANGNYDYTVIPLPIYSTVNFEVKGVGIPSGRIGISYEPIPLLTLGASYRMYTKITMRGDASLAPFSGFPATVEWKLPHALQFGLAFHLVHNRLLIALEERMQFHGAPRTGNRSEIVDVDLAELGAVSIFIPFDWRNVYGTRLGIEYEVTDLIDVRFGTGISMSATTDRFAIYFTPPPGLNYGISAGLGFNWKHVMLDIAGAVAGGGNSIGADVAAQGPITYDSRTFELCSAQQVVRSGCEGNYRVITYGASLMLTYRM